MEILYSVSCNKSKSEQTATPNKYPQRHFRDKPCRGCGKMFSPKSPSELYCSDACKDLGATTAYLQRSYGITYKNYEALLKGQKYKCAICGSEGFILDAMKHKLKLVVDHNHKTGVVRGLLCHNCNRGLGLFQDNPDILQSAIEYLGRATTIPKGSTPKQVEKVS